MSAFSLPRAPESSRICGVRLDGVDFLVAIDWTVKDDDTRGDVWVESIRFGAQ